MTTESGRINNGIRTENTARNSSQRNYPHEQLWYSMDKNVWPSDEARASNSRCFSADDFVRAGKVQH